MFAAGQMLTLRQLASSGLYLDTNPHASFVYLLTCLHALHLIGGMVVVGVLFVSAGRDAAGYMREHVPGLDSRLRALALYWHLLGVLWLYLLVLLFA